MAIFSFLYDDAAPGPAAQLKAGFDKAAACVGRAIQTPVGQDVSAGARFGLKVGAFCGTVIIVTGVAHAVVSAVFGSNRD